MTQDALRPGGGTEHWGTVMARSDLLVSLVKAGSSGDATGARSVAEAIIAEERAKRHNVLAERRIEDLVLPALTRQACDELIEEQRRAAVLRAHSLEPRHGHGR